MRPVTQMTRHRRLRCNDMSRTVQYRLESSPMTFGNNIRLADQPSQYFLQHDINREDQVLEMKLKPRVSDSF